MEAFILSLDLGTTSIKVGLVSLTGQLIASSTHEYMLLTPDVNSVELPTHVYWDSFKEGVRAVLDKSGVDPRAIRCMGISAQGETLFFVDKQGRDLRNAIVWMDNRAQEEAEDLGRLFPPKVTCEHTGQVSMVPTWPAAKLLWVKRHEPEIFQSIWKVMLIEDYFIWRMTGHCVCEGSLICSTAYWDIRTGDWWAQVLDYIGITREQLPTIRQSGDPVGTILPHIAEELGLCSETIVCMGVLDQVAGAIGVGNIRSGCFSECTGAALAICATTDKIFVDEQLQMPCHCHGVPSRYMAHTFTSGGMVLKWFRDMFCQHEAVVAKAMHADTYDLLNKQVEQVPAGCDGLIALPHLQGAMAPEANPKAKGVFYGITLKHTKAHFNRAVMEAIGFIVNRNIQTLERMGFDIQEIRVLGGGSKSPVWNQIKADITGKPVCLTNTSDAACVGAAIVAGTGLGIFSDLEEAVDKMIVLTQRFEPDPEAHKIYIKQFEKYIKLYEALCPVFELD